jgi:HTH-type transcriptional regulator/antitoxin HigA
MPDGDRLEVLTILVEHYENRHDAVPLPDPIEAIEYPMQSRGLVRRDLEPYLGARARVSEILNRRRPLTLRMIRKLQAGLGIPAEILIQPYALAQEPASTMQDGQVRQAPASAVAERRPAEPES